MKIGFIGAGNMGSALAKAAAEKNEVFIYDKDKEKAEELARKLDASYLDNEEIAKTCDLIFLAVKPNIIPAVAEELAGLLGGVLACTRPLVESNIMDAKRQIGLSGRTVKPKFILTLGISGAVQFAAGMKSSDCIVAINTDQSAPIFDVAHYAIVGDVSEILPRLIAKIKEGEANV